MSVLQTQRRMRPEISKLVANYLYPHLENAPDVQSYPEYASLSSVAHGLGSDQLSLYSVKGMKRDVYFIDHTLKEDTLSALHASRTNRREACLYPPEIVLVSDMLTLFTAGGLGRRPCSASSPAGRPQGEEHCRSHPVRLRLPSTLRSSTDGTTTRSYLGQVRVLQEAFTEQKVMVILDERDIGDLEAEGDDLGAVEPSLMPKAREEQLSSRVILRTVDRFQGEEADIVILSRARVLRAPSSHPLLTFALSRPQLGLSRRRRRTRHLLARRQGFDRFPQVAQQDKRRAFSRQNRCAAPPPRRQRSLTSFAAQGCTFSAAPACCARKRRCGRASFATSSKTAPWDLCFRRAATAIPRSRS